MKKTTYKMMFLIRNGRSHKNGKTPVYVRITVNGSRSEFVIPLSVDPKDWDSKTGSANAKSAKAGEINGYLELVKSKLRQSKVEMEERNITVTARAIRDRYMGIDINAKTILAVFQEHNEKCEQLINKDFSPETVERYNVARKHLASYINAKYRQSDMMLNEITPEFINDFEYYLKTERKCAHNTTVKYIKNFKKIVRLAFGNGWIKSDPFVNIRYRLEEVNIDFLTEEELQILMQKEFEIKRLDIIKDVYIFCCFTGLAFIDVKNLTHDDLIMQGGKMWINKRRQKTRNLCRIPLLEPPLRIIEKYRTHPLCIERGVVLPVPSNQKMNAYLKEIVAICGINKHLSTHTARHTFATTVTLTNQISLEVVSKMLGHSSVEMTERYARVVDDRIGKDMDKIFGKYS